MASEGVKDSGLGPLIRMQALKVSQLPAHQELASQQTNAPDILTFASSALEEADAFMTTYLPHHFKVRDSNKQAPPSTAPVELLSHDVKAEELPQEARDAGASTEAWFARTSVHENAAKDGTASWEEFDAGLRQDHSQHEKDYTPDVFDAHEVLNYDGNLGDRQAGGWEDIHASVMQMAHHIPTPLNDRVFTVIVIAAKRGNEFLDLQIPVVEEGLPNAKYSGAANVVKGMYCSIERGELIEDGKKVQWQMATASDAKGSLPMWAQKLGTSDSQSILDVSQAILMIHYVGVPGAVVKDVGLFVDWVSKRRKG